MCHPIFLLRKMQERKKEIHLIGLNERQGRSLDAVDENTPEILESTRLEEERSRQDKRTASF